MNRLASECSLDFAALALTCDLDGQQAAEQQTTLLVDACNIAGPDMDAMCLLSRSCTLISQGLCNNGPSGFGNAPDTLEIQACWQGCFAVSRPCGEACFGPFSSCRGCLAECVQAERACVRACGN